MKRGVLYIAFGDNFIKEMLFSAESVKKHNPELHITVFADRPVESEYIDKYEIIEVKHIRPKVDYVHQTPYEETIFLDTDTVINRDISEMFGILKKYDFAICHDLSRKRKNVSNIIPEYKEIPYSFSKGLSRESISLLNSLSEPLLNDFILFIVSSPSLVSRNYRHFYI